MKRTALSFSLIAVASIAASGSLLVGCGANQAQTHSAEAADSMQNELTPQERMDQALLELERLEDADPATLLEEIEREEEIADRVLGIESRLSEIEAREAALAEREAELRAIEQEQARFEPPARKREPVFRPLPRPTVDRAPEPAVETILVTIPATTPLEVEFLDAASSETSQLGDPVRAVVARDVIRDGLVAIPAGSRVHGSVIGVVPQKKIAGQAKLALSFERLDLPSGEQVAIQGYFDAEGKRQKKKDATTIGASAAGGAILGRILSKNEKTKGTVLGAAVGAAIGTAIATKNAGDPVVVEPGSVVELTLDAAVRVAVQREASATTAALSR
jgi:hypothetical protein